MLKKIRKFIPPAAKEIILRSFPYRLLGRLRLRSEEIRFSCELTTKCNARCDMCTRSQFISEGRHYPGDMDKLVTDRIVEEIKKFHMNGRRISFTPMGLGEPLLFKRLFEVCKEIKDISRDIGIVIVTNGIVLDEECGKKLISLGVDEVSISLNADNAVDYQTHMGVDLYDKVYRNIETLINARNASGRKAPSVFVQYLDYKNNQTALWKAIKQWTKIMRYNDKCYIHPIVNEAGFFKGKYAFNYPKENYPCTQPLFQIAVKVNGDMYPCDPCFYSGGEKIPSLYLGNIKTESIYDIYTRRESRQSQVLKQMRRGDYTRLPECERCNTYKIGCNYYFKIPRFLQIKGYKWL